MAGAKRKRKFITHLPARLRDHVMNLVDDALCTVTSHVGAAVYAELEAVARKDPAGQWALHAMKMLTIERLDEWAKQRQREEGTVISVGDKRVFVSDTRAHRVRVYDQNGVVFAWQNGLWWKEDWAVLAQMIQTLVAQGATLDEKVAGMRRGYALKDDYPSAKNVEEACAMRGVTVEQFLAATS